MATELSEQSTLNERVGKHLDSGDYALALAEIGYAWNEKSEWGTRRCTLVGFEDVFVKFKTRGYPFSLRKKWQEAVTHDDTALLLILPYVVAWNFRDIDGNPVELPEGDRATSLFDNIEDGLLMWLIREFNLFWFTELLAPRKN